MSVIDEKKQQIINDYHCYDSFGEMCGSCDECVAYIKKDLDEFEKMVREDCTDETEEVNASDYIKGLRDGKKVAIANERERIINELEEYQNSGICYLKANAIEKAIEIVRGKKDE